MSTDASTIGPLPVVAPHLDSASQSGAKVDWRASGLRLPVASFIATLPLIPLVALPATAISYITPSRLPLGLSSVHIGMAAALIGWVLLSIGHAVARLGSVEHANARSYGELNERINYLKARMKAAEAATGQSATPPAEIEIVRMHIAEIDQELMRDGDELRWVRATGYLNLWNLVHRAEEALIMVEPVPHVVVEARFDELRLMSSTMENRVDLLSNLRSAMLDLSTCARKYLGSVSSGVPSGASMAPAATPTGGDDCAALARSMISMARQAINVYRDDRRDGLVRMRRRLCKTVFLTGTATFALLAFAIVHGVPSPTLVSAVFIYLVGALAGLFNRLYLDSHADSATDDFGLTEARLLEIPLISGLSGLAGVLITALLPLSSGSESTTASITLSSIFNLEHNAFYLIVAAIFGNAPSLVLGRLSQAEQYKADLKSSKAVEGAN